MKRITPLLLLLLLLAACSGEEPGTGTLPALPHLSLHIPPYPANPNTRAGDTGKTEWEQDDVLYIRLECLESDGITPIQETLHIAQYTAAGKWEYDMPLTLHPATDWFVIHAYYTSGTRPGKAITGDLLHSYTDGRAGQTTITLNTFNHLQARITFTGLPEGKEIKFQGLGWWQTKLNDDYGLDSEPPASIIADAAGNAVLYAYINETGEEPCQFIIDDKTFNFDPGKVNDDDGLAYGTYYNRTYTIDCKELLRTGDLSPEDVFLAWAQGDNWNSDYTLTCDLDLRGMPAIEPIGDINGFTHTFDGGGHTITGLTVKTDGLFAGLFGSIGGTGTVKNLHLREVYIESTDEYGWAGGIASYNYGTINGCTVQGDIVSKNLTSGIAIRNGNSDNVAGTITACGYSGTLTGRATSGIAVNTYGAITGCWALADDNSDYHYPIANDLGNPALIIGCVYEDILDNLATMNTALAGKGYSWASPTDDSELPVLIITPNE